jgi:hypothetical protein
VKRLCDEQYIPEALQIARTYGNLFNVNMSVNEAGLVDRDGEPKTSYLRKDSMGYIEELTKEGTKEPSD